MCVCGGGGGGGGVHFSSLLLKADPTNTYILVEVPGCRIMEETLWILNSVWHSLSRHNFSTKFR